MLCRSIDNIPIAHRDWCISEIVQQDNWGPLREAIAREYRAILAEQKL
jgi:hypothetical protein